MKFVPVAIFSLALLAAAAPASAESLEGACSNQTIQELIAKANRAGEADKCRDTDFYYNQLMRCYDLAPREAKLALDEPLRKIESFLYKCASDDWKRRRR